MAKDIITVLDANIELVEALAAAYQVDIEVVAEYDDQLEIDVTGADIAEFVMACNAL